jgi:hypothetical protein
MATSNTKAVRAALIAIANADATLQSLCGRATRIMVPWHTIGAAQKPVLAVMIASNTYIGGDGDKRKVLALLAAFAEGNTADAKTADLIQRCRELYTPAAFQAQGLDAFVLWGEAADRESDDADDSPVNLARSDLDLPIIVQAGQ